MSQSPPLDLLRGSAVFEGFTDQQLAAAAGLLRAITFTAGDAIVREGDPADRWFVIGEGMAAVTHTDLIGHQVTLAVLGPGESFGERALTDGEPRQATVSALGPLTAYALERSTFREAIGDSTKFSEFTDRLSHRLDVMSIDAALKRASPFAPLSQETVWSLARQMQPQHAHKGEVVIREGDPGDCFYLIRSGRLQVKQRRRHRVAVLGPGDSFGEVALLTPSPRTATVYALEESDLLVLTSEAFLSVARTHVSVAGHFNELVRIRFKGSPGQSLLLPDPLTTILPLVGERRRKRYWLILLGGVLLFAVLSAAAQMGGGRSAQYAVMVVGSLIGPAVFVLYLVESHILSERPVELIATGVLGAALGLPPAIVLQRQAGLVPGSLLSAELIAVIEEVAKLLGVLWVIGRPALRFRMDGLIYGAAAGMGFAALEIAMYAFARVETVAGFLGVLWLRALLSPFTHGTWTAIVCSTIWQQRGAGWRRGWWKVAAALCTAIGLHGLWDWQLFPIPWNFLWLVFVGVSSILILRAVLHAAGREEARSVAALAPEVRTSLYATGLRCEGCGRQAPAGAHYCPRCGLALRHSPST
jgi:CRP-like cAMP-binding protein/RsiW-degrading membrane proteinase PrsW (M82 family)